MKKKSKKIEKNEKNEKNEKKKKTGFHENFEKMRNYYFGIIKRYELVNIDRNG